MSGLALLLILPAILLSAASLMAIEMGGETVSLQSTADKVHNTGLDIEDTIEWMWAQRGLPVDKFTLSNLEATYENKTGLLVSIDNVEDNLAKIRVFVQDPLGSARFEDILKLTEVVNNDE